MAYIGTKVKTVVVSEPVRAPEWVTAPSKAPVEQPEMVPVRRQSDGQ